MSQNRETNTCSKSWTKICTYKWQTKLNHIPYKAWFWCSRLHGSTFFTFPELMRLWPNWWPKTCKIETWERLPEQKSGSREVQETCKKRDHKSTNICHKCAPKGGSQKVIFLWFLGSPSQDGPQGVPGQAPRPKSMLKWRPWEDFMWFYYNYVILFGNILEMFRVYHGQHIDNIVC